MTARLRSVTGTAKATEGVHVNEARPESARIADRHPPTTEPSSPPAFMVPGFRLNNGWLVADQI